MSRLGLSPRALLLSAALSPLFAGVALAQEKDEVQKCDKPIGTLAVVEPQNEYLVALQRYQLGSPTGLIRMMVQQSKCFLVVERGAAMRNIQQERELAKAGELQQDENMGGGQMKAADFILTPAVVIASNNSGGVGGAVGGLLGRRGGGLAAVAGGAKFKEAQTSMLVADARTTIQVAAAEGKAKKTDFSLGALGFVGGAVGAVGGYTNTPEGKIIAASYLDNFNAIVTQVKADAGLMARAEKYKTGTLSGAETKAGAVFPEGTVLAPKIDNIKLMAEAKDGAKVVGQLKKTDELVFLGEESEGYLKVQGSNGEGWVKKTLVGKK